MAENKGLKITQTRGTFQIRGIVTGTEKENFYKETLTKTQKPFRRVNFGVKIDKENTLYLELTGMERDKVYFSKTTVVDGKRKTDVEDVNWKNRHTFNKEGFRLIGVNVGLSKTKNDKGQEINDKKILVDYDATKEISEHLKDELSVFVKGVIDYSHYSTDKGETKRAVKFIPQQVSLTQKPIDFEDEQFKPIADFTQSIVFTGIEQDSNNKDRFIVSALIINYNSIEDAEFVIVNKNLASMFKKNLKPYTGIKVWGNISVEKDVTQEEVTDCWGDSNEMDKINAPIKRDLIITGADPNTIDKTTYTEEIIEEAIAKINADKKALNDFGDQSGWGSENTINEDEKSAW